jgi:hypothetical protein
VSRPALGPTQPPAQWVPGVLSPGLKRGRGVTLTTHPHLVPRSRMSRSIPTFLTSAFVACSGTALAFKTLMAFYIVVSSFVIDLTHLSQMVYNLNVNPCICAFYSTQYKGRRLFRHTDATTNRLVLLWQQKMLL